MVTPLHVTLDAVVHRVDGELGESPFWADGAREICWIDINAGRFRRMAQDGDIRTITFPGRVGAAVPAGSDAAIVAGDRGLWRIADGHPAVPLPGPDCNGLMFNDGKCDPAGRFWVGSRPRDGTAGGGALFRFDADGGWRRTATGVDITNGMAWSPDARSFYLVDTGRRRLHRFAYDREAGTIGERSDLCDFAGVPGKPDGIAVDARGRIWCAMWDGSGIAIISPRGRWIGWLDLPCPRPTSCAFGGEDLRTLFVTTARIGVEAKDDVSGALLELDVGVAGQPVAGFGVPLETADDRRQVKQPSSPRP